MSHATHHYRKRAFIWLLIPASFAFTACSSQPNKAEKTISETIPITMANVRGHEEIYSQGWFIVSSSEKALQYANDHGIISAKTAIIQAKNNIASRTKKLGSNLNSGIKLGHNVGKKILISGTKNSQNIFSKTEQVVATEKVLAVTFASQGYSKFVNGYLTLGARTSSDLTALRNIPGGYFNQIKSDFKNLAKLSRQSREHFAPNIEASWPDAFAKGKQAFEDEYQASGTASNSLSAMTNILKGYWKAFYFGFLSPATENAKYAGTRGGFEIGNALALPTSSLLIISGRTVESLGMSVWYSTKAGIKLVSPTIEGGLLTGMSLLSSAAIPLTAVGGVTAGVVNQVAVTALTPVAATAISATKIATDTTTYSALVLYDIANAATRVSFEEASTGVVLGYNALTALPTQALLGVTSGVFFLAWDGPRLVIAYANGNIKNNSASDISYLPVGSVVDLKKLKQENGIEINIISNDPKVINAVLSNAPIDMQNDMQKTIKKGP